MTTELKLGAMPWERPDCWFKFCRHVRSQYNVPANERLVPYFDNELEKFNAVLLSKPNYIAPGTVRFKTEEDLTYFLLKFS